MQNYAHEVDAARPTPQELCRSSMLALHGACAGLEVHRYAWPPPRARTSRARQARAREQWKESQCAMCSQLELTASRQCTGSPHHVPLAGYNPPSGTQSSLRPVVSCLRMLCTESKDMFWNLLPKNRSSQSSRDIIAPQRGCGGHPPCIWTCSKVKFTRKYTLPLTRATSCRCKYKRLSGLTNQHQSGLDERTRNLNPSAPFFCDRK